MADVKKIATRVSYGKALAELGRDYDFVVMDADLSHSTNTSKFADIFPERFINCGIAEGNMISTAAGIASTGVTVFCSSFAMFATGRAYEQIRNSVGYTRLNVKICASHAGVAVGEDGATHQCIEDFNLMRGIPGMTVVCPADDTETTAAVKAVLEYNGPVYMRLSRQNLPIVFDKENFKFEIGKASVLKEGKDLALFATGSMIAPCLEAYEMLKNEGINISVINVSTIKPIDEETVIKYATLTGNVVTAEEHSVIGGLGSAVCEVLSEKHPTKVTRIGLNDVFGTSGRADDLMKFYGLDANGVCKKIKKVLGK